jgi:hypothetical protein
MIQHQGNLGHLDHDDSGGGGGGGRMPSRSEGSRLTILFAILHSKVGGGGGSDIDSLTQARRREKWSW